MLGVPDGTLDQPGFITRADESAPTVRLLRVGAATVGVGPAAILDDLASHDIETLDAPRVETLVKGLAGRTEILALCTDWMDVPAASPLISHETDDLDELLRSCPPDDVTEAELSSPDSSVVFVLLDDDHRPLAAAGYREQATLLADLRVITSPDSRRRGAATTALTLATHDALDAGLVPMMRIRRDNRGGRAVAATAGYDGWGTLVTVRLPSP